MLCSPGAEHVEWIQLLCLLQWHKARVQPKGVKESLTGNRGGIPKSSSCCGPELKGNIVLMHLLCLKPPD